MNTDQYLVDIFDFLQRELNSIQQNEEDEQQKFNDECIYHLINILIYVIKYCPNPYKRSN
jgi:hypothetical protein